MRAGKMAAGLLLALVALVGVGVALSWAPPPSQFVSIEGMQMHLRDEGSRTDPQPIVLLHGTSASLHTWDGWTEALKSGRRVIRMDLPGFGLTGPMPDGNYRLSRYVEVVIALLDQLEVSQVVLAGNSFGGNLAWKIAVDHPHRVSKLVLVDAAGYPFDPQSMPIGFKIAQIPALRPLMQNTLPRSMIESSVRNVYGDPSKVTQELIDRYHDLTLRAGNRGALVERFRQSPSGEFTAQISQVRQPTLILWGGQDRLIPPDNAAKFGRDIAGSRVVMFDALGHVPHEEDPAATVAAVQRFLQE